VIVEEFAIRRDSGGTGRFHGGDGTRRRIRFREAMTAAILSTRRETAPFGLEGGSDGAKGVNTLIRNDGTRVSLKGCDEVEVEPGDALEIETPGGGGFADKTAEWDRVHTIDDFFDIPRRGVADFRGKPHVYSCRFDETRDDWTDKFELMEIDPELLQLVLDQRNLWLRWREAFDRGETTIETHPVLLADKARYEELQALIGKRLDISPDRSVLMNGRFRILDLSKGDAQVQWLPG
jgi:hypothetical protein